MGRINKDIDFEAMTEIAMELPVWLVEAMTKEAKRRGVNLASLIKVWLVDRLVSPRKP